MVPSVYEDGTLYNVLPSGNKAPDETGNHNGYDQTRADFSFSRGSNLSATRINSDGLIEKGRENLLLQSNQFDTTWGNSNTTETSGQADKDGGTDAWLLTKSAGNGYLIQSLTPAGVQTASIYAKAGDSDWVYLQAVGTSTASCYFDLVNGTTGSTGSLIDKSIELIGNGWYRCSITYNQTLSNFRVYPAEANSLSASSGSVYIQSAQLEKSLLPTDYIATGATTAQAGILEDMPRINYDANGENGALLLEPSRTNSLTNSEYLLNYSVFSTSPTRTTNYGISPEGVKNSTRIQLDNGDLFGTSPALSSNTYTFSLFAKNIEGGGNVIQLRFDIPATKYAEFDLSDGTLVQSTTDDEGIEDYGNGWYRCYITMNSSTISNIVVSRPNASSLDCEVFGLQMEIGSYPSSYIPTHGAAVTRGADSCSVTGVSDVIGQSEGVVFFDWIMNHESPNTSEDLYSLALSDNSNNKLILVNNYNNTLAVVIKNTTNQFYSNAYTGGADGARIKLALAYKANDFALYINGTQIATDTSGSVPTLNQINLNSYWNGNLRDNTSVKQLALFSERLTNSELATLTTL